MKRGGERGPGLQSMMIIKFRRLSGAQKIPSRPKKE